MYHSLYRGEESGDIEVTSTASFSDISPNAIDDTFGSLVDREIEKSMSGMVYATAFPPWSTTTSWIIRIWKRSPIPMWATG